ALNAAMYSPINYLPQTLGMQIGKAIEYNKFTLAYAGRIMNLIVFGLLMFIAIRIIPITKVAYAVIGLLPMVVYQAASLSADSINFATSFVFFAFVIKKVKDGCLMDKKELLILSLAAIALALEKQSLIILSLIMVILPNSCFKSNKTKYFTILAIFLISITLYCLWVLQLKQNGLEVAYSLASHLSVGAYENPRLAILEIIYHPFKFIYMMLLTFASLSIEWFKQLIGIFGWLEIYLNNWNYYLALITLSIAMCINEIKPTFTAYQKLVAAALIILFIIVTEIALFIAWTPPESKIICGIQGRYFIPSLPLLLLIFSNRLLKRWKDVIEIFISTAIIANLYSSLIVIYQYYY
ncbi:MAG: DUF2142 domain-containing protein, partial [Burkholderiales bacterium]